MVKTSRVFRVMAVLKARISMDEDYKETLDELVELAGKKGYTDWIKLAQKVDMEGL